MATPLTRMCYPACMYAGPGPTIRTHPCEARFESSTLVRFAVLATLAGLITSLPSCASENSSVANHMDASNHEGSDSDGGPCSPKTCVQVEAMCGTVPDGCGGTIDCGSCPAGQTCGGGGVNQCGPSACVPKTCSQLGMECGWTTDQCGTAIDCGSCPASTECVGGKCLVFAWVTGDWSPCSKTCGGGTRTRDVWCERADGQKADSGLCEGTMPKTAEDCNSQPCCTTDSMLETYRCDGDALAQWYPWDPNSSEPASREKCQSNCTSWAVSNGLSRWCCQLADNSAPGAQWYCRVYDADSHHASSSAPELFFSSLGRCQ